MSLLIKADFILRAVSPVEKALYFPRIMARKFYGRVEQGTGIVFPYTMVFGQARKRFRSTIGTITILRNLCTITITEHQGTAKRKRSRLLSLYLYCLSRFVSLTVNVTPNHEENRISLSRESPAEFCSFLSLFIHIFAVQSK